MKYNRVIIGLGSNIDPGENIQKAKMAIESEFNLIGASSFVETEPVGFKDQPAFINGAVLIETEMSCGELKAWLRKLENRLGRIRAGNKDGPRTIDLDILVWNGEVIDREVFERPFLMKSVRELLPELNLG